MNEQERDLLAAWTRLAGALVVAVVMCVVNFLVIEQSLVWFFDRTSLLENALLGPLFQEAGLGDATFTDLWAFVITTVATLGLGAMIHAFHTILELNHQIRMVRKSYPQVGLGGATRADLVLGKLCHKRGQIAWSFVWTVPTTTALVAFDAVLFFLAIAMRIYRDDFESLAEVPAASVLLSDQWGAMPSTILILGTLAYVSLSVAVAGMVARSWIRLTEVREMPRTARSVPAPAVRAEVASATVATAAAPTTAGGAKGPDEVVAEPEQSSGPPAQEAAEVVCECGKRFPEHFYRAYGHPGCPQRKGESR